MDFNELARKSKSVREFFRKLLIEDNICPDCSNKLSIHRIDISEDTDCRERYCECGFKYHDNFFTNYPDEEI